MSVLPRTGVPVMRGRVTLRGKVLVVEVVLVVVDVVAAVTAAETAEKALALPAVFDAVTSTRSLEPRSLDDGV